jgi:hypothetical protein
MTKKLFAEVSFWYAAALEARIIIQGGSVRPKNRRHPYFAGKIPQTTPHHLDITIIRIIKR